MARTRNTKEVPFAKLKRERERERETDLLVYRAVDERNLKLICKIQNGGGVYELD
jgi:hypothetical protein